MTDLIYVIYKKGYKDLAVFNSYAEAIEAAENREGDDYIDSISKETFIRFFKTTQN